MLNIVKGPEAITTLVKKCITNEMNSEGLLSDVETFVPSYRLDEKFEEPCVWLFEQETTIADGRSGTLSHKLLLQTPFEFVCVVYDGEDIEQSEIKGKNLAGRVAASIARNFSRIDGAKNFIAAKPKLEAIYPVGQVQIEDKDEKAVATSVRIIFEYYVDWAICCKYKNNNNDDGD